VWEEFWSILDRGFWIPSTNSCGYLRPHVISEFNSSALDFRRQKMSFHRTSLGRDIRGPGATEDQLSTGRDCPGTKAGLVPGHH
jgi:hypothetical protein